MTPAIKDGEECEGVAGTPVALSTLPMLGSGRSERSDAVRNRRRILEVAERLFAEHGVGQVSMDMIARTAGVGKGTLFRRFGDRPSLARALLDDAERSFQEQFIRGAPPLGPGVPATDRLVAFGHGLIAFIERLGDLRMDAEIGPTGLRVRTNVHAMYRAHVRGLLQDAAPTLDGEYVADVLLSALSADFVLYLRREREMSLAELTLAWEQTVRRLCQPPAGS